MSFPCYNSALGCDGRVDVDCHTCEGGCNCRALESSVERALHRYAKEVSVVIRLNAVYTGNDVDAFVVTAQGRLTHSAHDLHVGIVVTVAHLTKELVGRVYPVSVVIV